MAIQKTIKYEYEIFANLAEPVIGLIDDKSITEIYIDSWDRISYMRNGKVYPSDIKFTDDRSFADLCEHLVKDIRPSNSNNDNYFSLNSSAGHRFSIYTPDIRTHFDKYSITIRLFRALEMLHDTMIELGAFTQKQYDVMLDYMMRGKNILICGKPNSGKTTIMRCILDSVIKETQPRLIFPRN